MVNHRLKELRTENKYSGPFVAERFGISPAYYYELERGEKRLNEDLIRAAAEFYGVSTDYLLKIDSEDNVIAAHHRGKKGEEIDTDLAEIVKEIGEKYELYKKNKQK
jgi:transcriptional regulator with XRE-family HTH domain